MDASEKKRKEELFLNPDSPPIQPIVGYSRRQLSRRPYALRLRTTPDAPCRIGRKGRDSSLVCLPIRGGSVFPRDAHAGPFFRLLDREMLLAGFWMTALVRVMETQKMECMDSSGSESGCENIV